MHIKSIARIVNRPRVGDRIGFDLGKDRNGRPEAVNAHILGANPVDKRMRERGIEAHDNPHERWTYGLVVRLVAAVTILGLALFEVSFGGAPTWLLWLYIGVGALSAGNYWVDKRAALADRWRTSEAKLHGLDFVGGIVGGLLAQVGLRHKTSKPEFSFVTAGIVFVHVAGLAALIAGYYELAG